MGKKTNWGGVPLPFKMVNRIKNVVKNTEEFTSIAEFARRAISDLLKQYEGRVNIE